MKSDQEIKKMIMEELRKSSDAISKVEELEYYNKVLGDTSYLLSALLDLNLRRSKHWDAEKWLDDSFLTKVSHTPREWHIWGVIIIGENGTTEQWTEPFYCFIKILENNTDVKQVHFLFGEENFMNVTYEEFNNNRRMFDRDFYSDKNWDPSERNWKYIINS